MKVVFINTLYAPNEIGGAERAVRAMAESLVASGDEAVVITLAPDGKASVGEVNGVRVHYVPLFNVGFLHARKPLPKWRRLLWHLVDSYNPIMGRRVQRILEQERPDLVECNNLQGFSVAVWRAAKRLGLPVMQVLHDYYLGCANSTMYRQGRNCAAQCADCRVLCAPRRRLSTIPSVVSAVSHRTLARICGTGMFPAATPRSIGPTGIRLEQFSQAATSRAARRPGMLVVGYLGRIEPVKGVDLLLEAVSAMAPGRIIALIAGGGDREYVDGLRTRFAAPNIEFLGVVDPASVFARIDLLVVPSLWEEPLTRVIAEAYAAGVPVAVSRLGGMPEIVDEGRSGYVFEGGSVEAIRQLLEGLPDQPLSAPEQVAWRIAKSAAFSVEAVYERHRALWQATASGTRSA